MQLLDEIVCEYFMLLLKSLQIVPFNGIQEIHEVEKLPHIVVQRGLWGIGINRINRQTERAYSSHYYPMDGAQLVELPE
jgi:hypothetical protein